MTDRRTTPFGPAGIGPVIDDLDEAIDGITRRRDDIQRMVRDSPGHPGLSGALAENLEGIGKESVRLGRESKRTDQALRERGVDLPEGYQV